MPADEILTQMGSSLIRTVKKVITDEIEQIETLEIGVIVDVNAADYTCSVRLKNSQSQFNPEGMQLNDVPLDTAYAGDGFGMMSLPEPDDWVVVGFINGVESGLIEPVVLTRLFRTETLYQGTSIQSIPIIAAGEWLFIHKTGAEIRFTASGDIEITPAAGRDIKLAGGGAAIARVGDATTVDITMGSSAGTYAGTITSGSAKVESG